MGGFRLMLTATRSWSTAAKKSGAARSLRGLARPAASASRSFILSFAAATIRSIRANSSPPYQPRRQVARAPAEVLAARSAERLAEPTGEVLDVLPGDAAGARAAGDRPFACLSFQLFGRNIEPEMFGIAAHDGLVGLLIEAMETKPKAEAVRHRNPLLDRFRRVDGSRTLVLDHVARHQVAAVRSRIEDDIRWPSLDAALEHGLQRFVAGVVLVEGQIVAKQQAAPQARPQQRQEPRQAWNVFAVDFH